GPRQPRRRHAAASRSLLVDDRGEARPPRANDPWGGGGVSTNGAQPLIETVHLKKYFPIKKGLLQHEVARVHAVDDVTLQVYEGQTLGLVGESGCGKSTLGRTIVRLLEPTDGDVRFEGRSIGTLGHRAMRPLRREMQMVFQDPYASLNPLKLVGSIIGDPMKIHKVGDKKDRRTRVQELLEVVG